MAGQVALSKRWGLSLGIPLQYQNDAFALRDPTVSASWRAVDSPAFVLAVAPGLSLPLGEVGGLRVAALSTGSVDPLLRVSAVAGSGWLLISSAETRVPLMEGSDGIVHGVFGRLDVQGGRRLNDVVVQAGLSGLAGLESSAGTGAYTELGPTAGAVFALWPRHALTTQARAALWSKSEPNAMVQVGWTAVLGGAEKEEVHSDDDGHDHGGEHGDEHEADGEHDR